MSSSSSSSSSSESLVIVGRILCPTNPNEELSCPAPHAVQEANRIGDIGDVGVGRVGDKGVIGVKRVNDDEGDNDNADNDKGEDDNDDNDNGDDDNGDDDNGDDDKGDDIDENDAVEGADEAGIGRGRIRRALCAEDTVYECVIGGGTAGKARARCG